MFKNYKKIKTPIMGKTYHLWVADSDEKRSKGLKGIGQLFKNHGMIFVYDKPVNHSYTMKGVKIPLKLIFLDKNFNILKILKGKPGQSNLNPGIYYNYVIEI